MDTKDTIDIFIDEFLHIKHTGLSANPLFALIDRVRYALNYTNMMDSSYEQILDDLQIRIDEAMKIAIVGQFSSGKSTFLNALLGSEVLPSGITPVTAKVCHILYGEDYMLEIHYKNGNIATKPLEYLSHISPQKQTTIAFYKLFAPVEILKNISFLDTPGFNSQNQSDTDTTNAVLESVDGIIWLTLIDNVGKQSEKNIIVSHIKRYASKSLCVLNQKDRLKNQTEIDTSLNYAKSAFNGLFEEIIAISAKDALRACSLRGEEAKKMWADSHIQYVLDFLQIHIAPLATQAKTRSICTKLRTTLYDIMRPLSQSKAHFKSLHAIFDSHTFGDNIIKSAFYTEFQTIFHTLESKTQALARFIFSTLQKREEHFIVEDKKFSFRAPKTELKSFNVLPREQLSLQLLKEENDFYRDFIKLGFDIAHIGELYQDALCAYTAQIEESLIHWYEKYNKDTYIKDTKQDLIKQGFLAQFLNDLKNLATTEGARFYANLVFIQKTLQQNYPLALQLCLTYTDLKTYESLDKVRKSYGALPLANPTLENIWTELKKGLHFSMLEEQLLTKPLHKKAIWEFQQALDKIYTHKHTLIESWEKEYTQKYQLFSDTLACIRAESRRVCTSH